MSEDELSAEVEGSTLCPYNQEIPLMLSHSSDRAKQEGSAPTMVLSYVYGHLSFFLLMMFLYIEFYFIQWS